MRTPEQAAEDAAYAQEFERRSKELYEQLRNDVKNELLTGRPSADASFTQYQNHLNDAALHAAEAKSGDHYQLLGVDQNAGPSEIRQADSRAIKDYDTDLISAM